MSWSVLDAANPHDRGRWIQLWNDWPSREVAAHPSYVELFTQVGQRALCATWKSPECNILFPFIMRPIGDEHWAHGLEGWDLASPYGYGGPFIAEGAASGVDAFWHAFDGWATDVGLVAAFARLSLFPDDLAPVLRGEVAVAQMNIVRDLLVDDEGLLRDYEHKVRKNIKRALGSGLSVEFDEDGSRLDEFLSIYRATMDRRSADDRYYFDRPFFERICSDLPEQYVFAHVVLDGGLSAPNLCCSQQTHAYSFLGGTLSDSFHLRPNDLLKHEVARWARDHGRSAYVLGGGYGGEDGIYRYKRSFAPKGEHEFRVWRHVVDRVAYDRAVSVRRDSEMTRGNRDWQPRARYFPQYRS